MSSLRIGALHQILLHGGSAGRPKNTEFDQLVGNVNKFGRITLERETGVI